MIVTIKTLDGELIAIELEGSASVSEILAKAGLDSSLRVRQKTQGGLEPLESGSTVSDGAVLQVFPPMKAGKV